ncbi:P-loop containing nucleoside triphosphate hydrolase protein [Mycena capillaripes]|nr:P-loop containing nucleoside triphosphate hydrolase protein [Mycena capillaripes]
MSCSQDSSFGPGSACRELDFTIFFEQSILSFAPDVLFFVFAALRVGFLILQTSVWPWPPSKIGDALLLFKCLAAFFTVCGSVANLIYSHRQPIFSASLRLAAPSFQIICAVLLIFLIIVEHSRSIAPSTLIISYSFLKAIFTAAIMRTSIIIGESRVTTVLLALVAGSYLLLSCLELIGKHHIWRGMVSPRVSTSSFISRSFYLWLLPLLWSGRNKMLTIADCGSIPCELRARSSIEPLLDVLLGMRYARLNLVRASLKAFPFLFISPILPRILLLVASFAQPLLVLRMITFVSSPEQSSARGWAIVGGFVCTYALIYLMTSIYWEKVFDCTVRYRAALVGNIYNKTLRLSSASVREVGGGVASTYMSVDVERVCLGLETLHEMWAALASIFLAVVILYYQATWPAFLPLAYTMLLLAIAGYISKGVGTAQRIWLKSTDKRIRFLTSVVHNYLPVKLSGYENVLADYAISLRAREMDGARSFYNNIAITGALASSSWTACVLSVLGPYSALAVRGHAALDPTRLFTIVATVNLLSAPLKLLGTGLPQLLAASASLKRIEAYFSMEDREDFQTPKGADENPWDSKNSVGDISLYEASFSWAADKPAFLGPITITLSHQHLHVYAGSVASGKSLFILSLLGESICTAGSVQSPHTSVAYASQDPLIVSGTIRENIVFGQEFSEHWYTLVLEACALTADIHRLAAGDDTFLDEKGTILSGGQRQRVALARAIYAKTSWTLLDDPFSSLDVETEKHIFLSLFGPKGLLLNKGVVLVTNNVKYLNNANHVLVFNAGALQYQGTLEEVVAAGYKFSQNIDGKDVKVNIAEKPESTSPAMEKEHEDEIERAEKSIAKESMGITPYMFYMRMAGWSGSIVVIVLLSLTGLARLGLQAIAYNIWSNNGGKHVGSWVGGYAGLTLGYLLLVYYRPFAWSRVMPFSTLPLDIHAAALRGLLWTSPSFAISATSGRIINRFSQDIIMTDLEFPLNVVNVIVAAIILGKQLLVCASIPWLTLIVPFLGAIYWIVFSIYLKTTKQLQHLAAASKSPLYTLFSTTLSGLVTIRALCVEKHFQSQNERLVDQSQIPFYFRFASIRLQTFLALISFILATALSVLAVGLRHSINPSSLGLALASLASLSGQLNALLMNLSGLENASVAISRIHEIAMLPKEIEPADMSETNGLSSANLDASEFREGSVVFQNVRLRYRAELKPAIDGVSFKASHGQKIGICGPSGSGKSSLLMALFRMVEPTLISGRIWVNGVDTSTFPLVQLRDSLSLVAQSTFIWQASLRHNLDPYGAHTDEAIWLTLERIGMHSAVAELPDKLETVLDDGGSLSTGQRQLLCLARVLLRKRRIVVLDEASSRSIFCYGYFRAT